jgi:hypothetical protein
VAVIFLSALFSAPLESQQPTAAPASPQAESLLQRARAALSGPNPISDVTLTGTARRIAGSDDESGSVTLKAMSRGEARLDMVFPSGQLNEVRSTSTETAAGRDGAKLDSRSTSRKIPFFNLLTEPAWFFPAFILQRASSDPRYTATYVGHETLDSEEVEHLSVSYHPERIAPDMAKTIEDLSKTEIFLESSTLRPVLMTFNTHPEAAWERNTPVAIRFSDFRNAGTSLVPYRIQKYIQNVLVLDVEVQTVQLNSGLTATLFESGKDR